MEAIDTEEKKDKEGCEKVQKEIDDEEVQREIDQEEQEQSQEKGPDHKYMLYPRSKRTFYDTLLAGMRLWKRPPHDHCSRCAEAETTSHRISKLTCALNCLPTSPEAREHDELVQRAGGKQKAWEELRKLETKMPDLKKHTVWFATQRDFLKKLEGVLKKHQALLQLDYGGFNDSAGRKVSVWSATIIRPGEKQRHVDFFFDAANQQKKNGAPGPRRVAKLAFFSSRSYFPSSQPSCPV